jgi:hypothetical protein
MRVNTAEALRLFQGLGDFVGVATCLRLQGWLALEQGQLDVAEALDQASYAICCANREERGIGESLRCLAEVSHLRADTAEAIARYRQATALLRDAAEGALARQAQAALDALLGATHR